MPRNEAHYLGEAIYSVTRLAEVYRALGLQSRMVNCQRLAAELGEILRGHGGEFDASGVPTNGAGWNESANVNQRIYALYQTSTLLTHTQGPLDPRSCRLMAETQKANLDSLCQSLGIDFEAARRAVYDAAQRERDAGKGPGG